MPKISAIYTGQYLNASELPQGRRQTLMIHSATLEEIGQDDRKTQKIVLSLVTPKGIACGKDVVLNKGNAIVLAAAYGGDTDTWIGKPIEIWAENVMFQGKLVPGIKLQPAARGNSMQAPPASRPASDAGLDDQTPF